MPVARRQFVQGLAMAITALPAALSATGMRLPIGFSTLGCPAWDWLKIIDFGEQNGFASIELRGLAGTMDFASRQEFSAARLVQSKKQVAAHCLRISCMTSSANLHEADAQKHEQQRAEARRFIDLASNLGAP